MRKNSGERFHVRILDAEKLHAISCTLFLMKILVKR